MNISGKYETNNGEMTIEKEGNGYKGSYAKSGTLEGKLDGHVLEGTWHNNGQKGLFLFEFNDDGSFAGKYKKGIDTGAMRGKWSGKSLKTPESNKDVQVNTDEYGKTTKHYKNGALFKWVYESNRSDYKWIAIGEFDEYTYDGKSWMFLKSGRIDYSYPSNYEVDSEYEEMIKFEEGVFEFFDEGCWWLARGKRELINQNKAIEEGEFEEGCNLIRGKRTYPEGVIVEGEFGGEGNLTITKPNGTVLTGKYDYGKLVEGELVSHLGFKAGDVVTLKSGGVEMTLEQLDVKKGEALCIYVYRGKITKDWISLSMLKLSTE